MSLSVAEAHIVLIIAAVGNIAGLVAAVLQIRALRSKLNGHLRAHHREHDKTDRR